MNSKYIFGILTVSVLIFAYSEGFGCLPYGCGLRPLGYRRPYPHLGCSKLPLLRAKLLSKYLALKRPLCYPRMYQPPCYRSCYAPCAPCPLSYVPSCLKQKAAMALCS